MIDRATLAIGAAVALVVLTLLAQVRLRRALLRRELARRRAHAAEGEERAEGLLERAGYEVLGRQVAARYFLDLDDERAEVRLRADYVVQAAGRRFVAEVKTGRLAPRIDTAATRRQLLEYRFAFDVEGVLLVDADAERIVAVGFPIESRPPAPSRFGWLFAGVALGATGFAVARVFF